MRPRGNPLWILLLLLTVLTVSRVHQYIPLLAMARPALLVFLAALLLGILRPQLLAPRNLLASWPGRVMVSLGLLACVSAPFGLSLGGSASYILQAYSKTLIYGALLILAIRDWQDLSRLVWAYVIGVGILAALSIFVVGISKTTSGATYDANDVGLIIVVGIPLAIVALQTSVGRRRILSAIILILCAVTTAKTESRGAFVGLLVVGLGILVSLRSVSVVRRLTLVAVAAAALVLAAPKGYWDLINTLRNPKADYNWDATNGRREVAKRGVGYMLQYPILGIGINNFSRAEGTISSKARTHVAGTGIRWAAPHNSFVEVGAELGVPGLLLWSSLIFGGIFAMYRVHRRLPRDWRSGDPEQRFLYSVTAGLPIALAGFAVTSFFVSFSYLDPIYILSAMVSGVYITLPSRLGSLRDVSARRPIRGARADVTVPLGQVLAHQRSLQ